MVAGYPVDDDALLFFLSYDSLSTEENKLATDEEFFRGCLTRQLPKSAKLLIKDDRENNRTGRILSKPEEPSILFEVQEEEVAIEIMKTYTKESWKIKSVRQGTEENLLHFFTAKQFERALTEILEAESVQEDVKDLCFQSNAAQKIPLMTRWGDGALKIWNFIEKYVNGPKDINHIFGMTDKGKENILFMCSSNGQNNLLTTIHDSKVVSKHTIQNAITQQNSNGQTALDVCRDEETILNILSNFDYSSHKLTSTDTKGKNIFHHYARKDFDRAIGLLLKKLSSTEAKDLILQEKSSNGSNVLMTAATHSSHKTLQLLLNYLSLFPLFQADDKDSETVNMDRILHHRNAYGNTILSLVLQHKDDLQIPKIILLGMENDFHSKEGESDDLACCFYKHLKPSGDVLRAIQEVEKTKEKGKGAIVGIWVQSFFKGFFIPVGIMATDILFDIFLVQRYYYLIQDQDCLTAQWSGCHYLPPAFDTSCGLNTTDQATQGNGQGFFCIPNNACKDFNMTVPMDKHNVFCIPLKLDARPRFFYSLGFIVWPWVYYFIEFLQSDVFAKMRKVVNSCVL